MRLLLLGMLAACSAAPPVAEPVETRGPAPAPEVAPPCKPSPAPECAPTTEVVSIQMQIPGGVGFWCSSFRSSADDTDPLGACYRSQATCERIQGDARSSGHLASDCERQDTARCFTMADNGAQAMYWRCYDSDKRCGTEREKHKDEHGAKFVFSECRESR